VYVEKERYWRKRKIINGIYCFLIFSYFFMKYCVPNEAVL